MEPPVPDTRTALLHAALECFSERGFAATSTRMIADRAQRPLSLLSHYFGHKEGLYLAVFTWMFESCWGDRTLPEGGHKPGSRDEAIQMLRDQIQDFCQDAFPELDPQWDFQQCSMRLFLQEVLEPRPCLHDLMAHYLAPRTATIRNCIRMLRPDLDDGETTFLGISILGQITGHGLMRGLNRVAWEQAEGVEATCRIPDRLVDLCLHGLMGLASPQV